MNLSVVIPVYNAASTIAELVEELKSHLVNIPYEVILINDCSKDNTEEVCNFIARKNPNVTLITLRKNAGEHNAVMCGLNHSKGEYIVIIDDDFQNPPSEIIKLYNEIQKGFDVVYSKYAQKKHSMFRNAGSFLANMVANILIDKPANLYLSSFKIIRHDVVQEIIRYKGPFPYIDGLLLRVTSNVSSLTVNHSERKVGKSNYNLAKLVALYMNMFVNFSIKPMRLMIFSGMFFSFLGLVLLVVFVLEKISNPSIPLGWTAIATMIVTFSGFQIVFLGLLGEYLGKQYLDQNSTPQWTVKYVRSYTSDAKQ